MAKQVGYLNVYPSHDAHGGILYRNRILVWTCYRGYGISMSHQVLY